MSHRGFDQGPIPEGWVVITRCERIDVDLRFSLLEIKRADFGYRDPKHTVHYTRVATRRFEGLWR
jgi:hypothetical protein